jgi:hypothetical protein
MGDRDAYPTRRRGALKVGAFLGALGGVLLWGTTQYWTGGYAGLFSRPMLYAAGAGSCAGTIAVLLFPKTAIRWLDRAVLLVGWTM